MGSSSQTITIHYATSDISALAGTDYTAATGTLTIPAGNTSGTFTVPISGYTESSNVTFAVTLSSPTHATLFSPTSDTVTILEQPLVEFAVAAQSVDCNAGSATIEVDLTASSNQTITVAYATSDMSAHSAIDYTPATSTLTIPAGHTRGTFTVPIIGQDGTSNLTFAVTLIGAMNATLGSPTTDTVTIIEQPRIMFSTSMQSVDCNAGSATVKVNVMGSSSQTITIHYATSDISAHAGTDATPHDGGHLDDSGRQHQRHVHRARPGLYGAGQRHLRGDAEQSHARHAIQPDFGHRHHHRTAYRRFLDCRPVGRLQRRQRHDRSGPEREQQSDDHRRLR